MDQREIKFRAFNKYGMSAPFTLKEVSEFGTTQGEVRWPDPTIFMQFTGLKDKQGKEIYEGDVVVNGLSGTWIIQPLEQGSMSLIGICEQYKDRNFDISALNQNVEVIGNIYEHPELVTQS